MIYRLGQKVVCIKDYGERVKRRWVRLTFPIRGRVYTVRGHCDLGGVPAIVLVEITNPAVRFAFSKAQGEASFAAHYFRPVHERKTDISVFKAMLNTTTESAYV